MRVVERYGPNVVILDASESPAATSRTAAAVEANDPRVSVLNVADDDSSVLTSDLDVLPKWASFETLVEGVLRVGSGPPFPPVLEGSAS